MTIFSGLTDSHDWFSTLNHRADSSFTTVQRVTCCLSLFMSFMVTNIIFYGIEGDPSTEQKMDLGPTTITWTELRISVFCLYDDILMVILSLL